MTSINNVNLLKEDPAISDKVDIRQMLVLVISAGGVHATSAIVVIFTIKNVAPLRSHTLAQVTERKRLYFLVHEILLGLSVSSMALVSQSIGQRYNIGAYQWVWASLLLAILAYMPIALLFWVAAELLFAVLRLSGKALYLGVDFIHQLTFYIPSIAIYLILTRHYAPLTSP